MKILRRNDGLTLIVEGGVARTRFEGAIMFAAGIGVTVLGLTLAMTAGWTGGWIGSGIGVFLAFLGASNALARDARITLEPGADRVHIARHNAFGSREQTIPWSDLASARVLEWPDEEDGPTYQLALLRTSGHQIQLTPTFRSRASLDEAVAAVAQLKKRHPGTG